MNPKAFCKAHDMKTRDFVAKAREVAPKYSKIAHTFASDPAYGVTIAPALSRHMRGPQPRRKKPCKFTFRLGKAVSEAFNRAKTALGHTTDQQAVEYAVLLYIEKAAREADTSQGGTNNNTNASINEGS